jgi:hypothetical protein
MTYYDYEAYIYKLLRKTISNLAYTRLVDVSPVAPVKLLVKDPFVLTTEVVASNKDVLKAYNLDDYIGNRSTISSMINDSDKILFDELLFDLR